MNRCHKCEREIHYDEYYATVMYHIENLSMDNGGNFSVQVISAEEILMLCNRCLKRNDTETTKAYLENIIKQADPGLN